MPKTCIFPGCLIYPSYNFQTEKQPLYCACHKKEHMVNIKFAQ